MRYIELFAGIGGFRQALDRLGGECVFASEIDRYAARAYEVLYGEKPAGDITKIDVVDIPDHDLLVGGFPCQAFSVAGHRKGFEDTRGTLFFEIARIASGKQPRLMLLENVKGLLSHDEGRTFDVMCSVLNDIGYAIDFAVLNSKYFGVPQNRERVFIVCLRDAEHEDWEIPGGDVVAKTKRRMQELGIRTFNFEWPTNDTVTRRLRDVLETNVDEKYYLSEDKTAKLIEQMGSRDSSNPIIHGSLNHYGNDQMNRVYSVEGVSPTITVVSGGGREQKIAEVQSVGNVNPSGRGMNGQVYDIDAGLAPTLTTNKGEGIKVLQRQLAGQYGVSKDVTGTLQTARVDKVPMLIEEPRCIQQNQQRKVFVKDEVGTLHASMTNNQAPKILETEVRPVLTPDREEKRQNRRRFKDDGEESFTLTAQDRHGVAIGEYPRYRIRRLTPLECWRLQGFTDEHHSRVKAADISDNQRYKQAGNAVTVNMVEAIGERLKPLLQSERVVHKIDRFAWLDELLGVGS